MNSRSQKNQKSTPDPDPGKIKNELPITISQKLKSHSGSIPNYYYANFPALNLKQLKTAGLNGYKSPTMYYTVCFPILDHFKVFHNCIYSQRIVLKNISKVIVYVVVVRQPLSTRNHK